MAWQQTRRSTAQSNRDASSDGILGKAVMFLDGASYIIAFYLVDTFTFGPPQLRVVSPSVREEYTVGTSPGSPTRRFASESEISSTPIHRHHHYHQSREKSASEGQGVDATLQESSSSSSSGNEKTLERKDDYFTNRSLHHHQKKLFSRQASLRIHVSTQQLSYESL